MPAMTVGAPSAELDLDLFDRDRRLDSGVAAAAAAARLSAAAEDDPPASEGVAGGCSELDRDRDREALLRARPGMMISAGCLTANESWLSRPPRIMRINLSSSRTSASGSGYSRPNSSSDTFRPGVLPSGEATADTAEGGADEAASFCATHAGTRADTHASGMKRISTPTGIEMKPSTMAMAHSAPVCPPGEMEKAAPPKKMMMTCAPLMMMLMAIK